MSSRDISPYYARGSVPDPTLSGRKKAKDWRAGFSPVPETKLQRSGLRSRPLGAVLGCLVLLWLIAIATTLCNILILVTLGMNARGMEALQFLVTPGGEPVVQFTGDEIHLGTVVTNNGIIGGYQNQTLPVEAARVILSTGGRRKTGGRLVVESGRMRAEGVENFLVREPQTGRPLFSARRPRFHLAKKSIKRIAAQQIVTDKVRSPVDKALKFLVENLSFRGNEGNTFRSKTFRMSAENTLSLRTSESGSIRVSGGKGVWGVAGGRYPVSSSPALRANVLGHRVCLCGGTGRLFAVPGNKDCRIHHASCS